MTAKNKKGRYYVFRGTENQETVPMKEYFEAVIRAMELATTTAKDSMEKRLDSMNEFREALKDQAGKFVTRTELIAVATLVATVAGLFFGLLFRFISIGPCK